MLISGFEHNAVVRPLYARKADLRIAGRRLFQWEEILESFRRELRRGVDAAVFTYVSNVFGYILPVEKLAALCREAGVPFILDAAQAAGSLKVSMELGADFIAMPGHKGLLGPQGTGLLLCGQPGKPLLYGGTGSQSRSHEMPQDSAGTSGAGDTECPRGGRAGGWDIHSGKKRHGCHFPPGAHPGGKTIPGSSQFGLPGLCRGAPGGDCVLPGQGGL